jgi:hypothetical protein
MLKSNPNLPTALFAVLPAVQSVPPSISRTKLSVMTRCGRHAAIRSVGIAAYPEEWHHSLQGAEIFAWSSRKIRRMIAVGLEGSGVGG